MNAVAIRGLLTLALGAGIAVGAIGIVIFNTLFSKRKRLMSVERDVHRLESDLTNLRSEVERLRRLPHVTKRKNGKQNVRSISGESDVDTDLFSVLDTEDGDEEFYDFSDEEQNTDPTLSQLFNDVDRLVKGSPAERQEAYNSLKEHYKQYSDNPDLLWRFAKAAFFLAQSLDDSTSHDTKKDMIFEGCNYAEKALHLDPCSADAHKWVAILVGSRGQYQSVREKINDGFAFKKHLDEALRLKPDDPMLFHLLGRFNLEVASLSWIEKSVAATLFGLPSTSVEEALTYFLHAEELSPKPWKENLLYVARCYEMKGKKQTAIEWLVKAASADTITQEDEVAEEEVQEMLAKLSKH